MLKSVITVIRGQKYSKYSYFYDLKGKLSYKFPKHLESLKLYRTTLFHKKMQKKTVTVLP